MLRAHKLLLQGAVVGSVLALSAIATAQESKQGPMTISAGLGFAVVNASFAGIGVSETDFRGPSLDFSYHLNGHSSGLNVGARQEFWFLSGGALMATMARGGYDIPVFFDKYELTIAPFAVAGLAYGNGGARFAIGGGVEGRIYLMDHVFAYLRPLEIIGFAGGDVGIWNYNFAVGGGYTF